MLQSIFHMLISVNKWVNNIFVKNQMQTYLSEEGSTLIFMGLFCFLILIWFLSLNDKATKTHSTKAGVRDKLCFS